MTIHTHAQYSRTTILGMRSMDDCNGEQEREDSAGKEHPPGFHV
jgi:hypothetical protein